MGLPQPPPSRRPPHRAPLTMPTAPPGRNSRVLPHSDPPALGMEQPAAPQSPTGASSRLFHLPTPPGGCAQRGPPAGEDGSTHLPPGLSRNFSPTPLASTARSAVFPPPPPREWKRPPSDPAGSTSGNGGVGAQWPARPYLCSALPLLAAFLLLLLPGASVLASSSFSRSAAPELGGLRPGSAPV